MTTTKGGATLPICYCIFDAVNPAKTVLYDINYDKELYRELPNFYAVCVKNKKNNTVEAAFILKTTYDHKDLEFPEVLEAICSHYSHLQKYVNESTSFLPAVLSVPGDAELSESEILRVLNQQRLKHSQTFQ